MAIRRPPVTATANYWPMAAFVLLSAFALLAAPARADHHPVGDAHEDHADTATGGDHAAQKEIVLYESGVHYEELLVPVPTSDPNKVEVIEMFSYACIHCFNFDAAVSEWALRQDDGVAFSRVPAIFSKDWALLAQAFYTAEALGVSDKTHDVLFESIHTAREDLRSPEAISAVFEQAAGVDKEAFLNAFNSFSVRSKVQQADSRSRQVRLSAVPTLVVNGKYKTSSSQAGTNIGMLQVVDFLIKKEQAAAQAKKTSSAAE